MPGFVFTVIIFLLRDKLPRLNLSKILIQNFSKLLLRNCSNLNGFGKNKNIKRTYLYRKFINDFFPGKNVANPTAMLLSSAQMLEHIGLRKVINKKNILT
jgi:hypothetical protein